MILLDILYLLVWFPVSVLINRKKPKQRTWRSEIICRGASWVTLTSVKRDPEWFRKMLKISSFSLSNRLRVRNSSQILANQSCQLFEPVKSDSNHNLIIFFHGGAFITGAQSTYASYCRYLTCLTGMPVLLVSYRMAPEFPYPAAHQDSYEVMQAIGERFGSYKWHVVGESAGGNLALSVAERLVTSGCSKQLASLTLISPWLKPSQATTASATDILDPDVVSKWYELYTNDRDADDIEFDNLKGQSGHWPPVYIQYDRDEILAPQIRTFADHLAKQEVAIETHQSVDQFHSYQIVDIRSAVARVANLKIREFIASNARTDS